MSKRKPPKRPDTSGQRRNAAKSAKAVRAGADQPPVVGFVSLGCAKNLVDSEKMLGQIAESGAILADESAADTIVVNTCGFLESSRQEALAVISELAERKRRGTLQRLVVAGCLVQRDGASLRDAIPEIDALVGVNNREDVPAAVWGARGGQLTLPQPLPKREGGKSGETSRAGTDLFLGEYHPQPWSDQGRFRLTPRHYAYVRLSEGCNQKCTFCTIPSIRGPMHCKTPAKLTAECRELIADGARELILIGQDTTSYGADIGYEPGLAGLLRTLDAACDGARWIRLMYVYPSIFTDEMIDAIAAAPRVVKYIDIPLQHINDRMLRAMGRRVTRNQTETLLAKLRAHIPGVTIRTTFIVGFPGESEAEFDELLEFVRGFGFDAVGAFPYSLEAETPAGRMTGHLPDELKKERYERLMLAQQELALAAAQRHTDATFEVVVDGHGKEERVVARSAGQAPDVDGVCLVEGDSFEPGEALTVRCVGADGYDLRVRPVARSLQLASHAGES